MNPRDPRTNPNPRTNYDPAYREEARRNEMLARENEILRNRHVAHQQSEAANGFLIGVIIAAIAALGFGAFYFFGRSETQQEAAPPQIEVPDVNVEAPQPPDIEVPDVNVEAPPAPQIEVPDVDVQVPNPTAGEGGAVPGTTTEPAPAPAPGAGQPGDATGGTTGQ